MRAFRALVVDDEPLAREVVVDLLRRDTEIADVTETGDPRRVAGILSSDRPDIVFLDIEMPGLTGMQIASSVGDNAPAIVFVTAFGEYALEAVDVQATDYLLKPFSDARFFQALDRAKRRVIDRRESKPAFYSDESNRQPVGLSGFCPTTTATRLAIGHGDEALSIDVADVLWIEADDYYVRLHTKQGRHLLRTSMSSLEERLDPRRFVRTHRAAIVNVREIQHLHADATTLVLSDGMNVAVSRSRRPIVERILRPPTRVDPE
jgi:two-component system, LytTR family, response regulator